jgi:hypothetical protein
VYGGLGRQGAEHGAEGGLCGLLAYEDVVGGWPGCELPLGAPNDTSSPPLTCWDQRSHPAMWLVGTIAVETKASVNMSSIPAWQYPGLLGAFDTPA